MKLHSDSVEDIKIRVCPSFPRSPRIHLSPQPIHHKQFTAKLAGKSQYIPLQPEGERLKQSFYFSPPVTRQMPLTTV